MCTRVLSVVLLLCAGCSSEPVSEEQNEQDGCEMAYTKLCDRACACTAGDACDVTDGMGTVVSSDNRDECLLFIDLFCGSEQARPPNDAQCSADIDSAACETQDDGDQALVKPTSCDPP